MNTKGISKKKNKCRTYFLSFINGVNFGQMWTNEIATIIVSSLRNTELSEVNWRLLAIVPMNQKGERFEFSTKYIFHVEEA